MKEFISPLILVLVVGGGLFAIYWFVKKKFSKETFIERPERGKVREILERTNQISEKKKEELENMNQNEIQHELNKSFKRMNKIYERKNNENKP